MLQMGGGQRDDLGMVSVLLHENMCCDPSLEPSRRGGSNEGHSIFLFGDGRDYL